MRRVLFGECDDDDDGVLGSGGRSSGRSNFVRTCIFSFVGLVIYSVGCIYTPFL
jgi:hypothetical protein